MSLFPDVWGGGQLLAFSGLDGTTDYNNGLVLRTAFENYALEVKQPETIGYIRYIGELPERVELTGDWLAIYGSKGVSRGVLADAHHFLLEGEFGIELSLTDLIVVRQGSKTLVAVRGFFDRQWLEADMEDLIGQRSQFLKAVRLPSDLAPATRRTAVKALSQLKTQIYSAEGQIKSRWSTPDRWPHQNMWIWDSVFHAIGMRHYSPAMAREILGAMFDAQQEDGFIPHMASPYHNSEITQPPVLGLGIELVNQAENSPEWVAGLVPKLAKFLEWIMAHRDSDGAGLVEWAIEAHESCRSGESGMDNSPRFDGAIQLDAPDFNAYLAHECEIMARLQPDRKDYWNEHHRRLCRLINQHLWNEELGFYVDYDVVGEQQLPVMASSGFIPLLCGAPSQEQAARLCAHLSNPETFGTPLRVPSIARNNPAAYSKDMWRGPVWININYLIALGLERYGFRDDADRLMRETRQEQERFYLKYGTFFEFYDDRREGDPPQLERKGKLKSVMDSVYHQVLHDYGWSGTLFLEIINHPNWR